MAQPVQIVVGGGGVNPVAGATEYNNPQLAGLTGYVDRSGYGIWGYENYEILPTGGFRLLNGFTFSDGEVMFFVPTGLNYGVADTSAYTNGFNATQVLSALVGRVGWVQEPGFALTLDATNLTSRSGRRFNDGSFHSLVTLQNVFDTMPQRGASQLQFNAWLTALQRGIILRCLNGVFRDPEYISQSLLYCRDDADGGTAISNTGKFVGVQITVPKSPDIAVQIDSVALLFDGAATFNLYVFNDLKSAPLKTVEVTTEANNQVVVSLQDCILNHIGGSNHGGIFYIGYFQDDLGSVRAIREDDADFTHGHVYRAEPIESDATGATSFDRDEIRYTRESSGINPHISAFRDHTWKIVKKPSLFDNVIGLQMAAQIMEQMMFTMRSNATEREGKTAAQQMQLSVELTGVAPITDGPHTTGLRKQIQQELERLSKAFQPSFKSTVLQTC